MNRLGVRRRLFLVVVLAVAAAVAVLIAGADFLLTRNLSHDADNLVRARATAELQELRTVNGKLSLGRPPDDASVDAQVWVFAGTRLLESPRADPQVAAVARSLVNGPARRVDIDATDTRLYAAPVVSRGRRIGTVVATVSLRPYEETRSTALKSSLAFGLVLLILVAVAARWLLAGALRPVGRMTRQAAAWSERDLDHRFALGEPSDELTELAATLDQLLDRLAASLRREQRFSAELSHELRTPLSRVIAEAELALRRPRRPEEYRDSLAQVLRNAQQVARTIDALVAAARHETGIARGTADAFAVAEEAADACATLAAERNLAVEIERPNQPIRIGVDQDLAERILQPVLENACRYGRRSVHLSVRRLSGAVVFTVDDDGPGIDEDERERIFDPGVRGRAPSGNAGAGLGLALARRLARSVSGEIDAGEGSVGARILVRLPAG